MTQINKEVNNIGTPPKNTSFLPKFQPLNVPETMVNHIKELAKANEPIPHGEILNHLKEQFEKLDFVAIVFPEKVKYLQDAKEIRAKLMSTDPETGALISNKKLTPKEQVELREKANKLEEKANKLRVTTDHYLIVSIENIKKVAEKNSWGLCKNQEFVYLYNGAFWTYIEKETFQMFLGDAALKMGVDYYTGKVWHFREKLLKQFLATEYLPTPEPPKETVLINLRNGTFEINSNGNRLRQFEKADFITYQLPFDYNLKATAPKFKAYLNKVLPDVERQRVIAEFLGFVFIKNGSNSLKEEKALILYGTGANGKSVFFEIVNALLGIENVSSYSLQSLTESTGYYRAMIANKLVNYASEINGNLETSIFKQLVSGEPVEARLPYGRPMQIRQYSKLIFNCNELPKEVEHTNAYFRRFLIIPFDVTIPEHEQDKQLHTKIIESELSGVFNWVLEGLERLLSQKRFSKCDAAIKAVESYKTQSDSVKLFIEENSYKKSEKNFILLKTLYMEYRTFCIEDGFKPVNKTNFSKRVQGFGIVIEKKNIGNVVFIERTDNLF